MRPGTSLLLNSHPPATKEELLEVLPERGIVDRLVSRYFNSNSPALRELIDLLPFSRKVLLNTFRHHP